MPGVPVGASFAGDDHSAGAAPHPMSNQINLRIPVSEADEQLTCANRIASNVQCRFEYYYCSTLKRRCYYPA
jgi:hypothetical protein